MESFLILLLIGLVTCAVVLPIVAIVKASGAARKVREATIWLVNLRDRLTRLETEVLELTRRAAAPEAAQPVPAPAVAEVPEAVPTPEPEPVGELPSFVLPGAPVEPQAVAAEPPAAPAPPAPEALPTTKLGVEWPPERVPAAPAFKLPQLDWEQFIGIKLFMWVAGLALFLGVVFFLKHSIDRGWITPPLRVAMGIVAGLGLIVGGLCIRRDRYAVGVQALTGAGVLILYACVFASCAFYHFIGHLAAFALMALVTAAAFVLAVRLEAPIVALLGLLGGFLTPPLLSTGEDRPLGLFGYIALLDAGLIAVALRTRWNYLVLLAAAATVVMQYGWVVKFLDAAKTQTGMTIFLAFTALFGAVLFLADRRQQVTKEWSAAGLLLPASALVFASYLILAPYRATCQAPWVLFGYVFAVDAAVLAIAGLRRELRVGHVVAGLAVFVLLGLWTLEFLTTALLNWALALYLVMAVLHAVYPVVIERRRPGAVPTWTAHLFAPLALLLVLIPIFKLAELTLVIWPVILVVDLLAIILAALTLSLVSVLAVLLLTVLATACWILKLPAVLSGLPETLFIIGGFAVFFFAVGIWMAKRFGAAAPAPTAAGATAGRSSLMANPLDTLLTAPTPELARELIASLSALLPFLLLAQVVVRLPLADPSPVFGLAALMVVLLFGMVRCYEADWVALAAFAGTALLEFLWHAHRFDRAQPVTPLLWYLGFYVAFAVFPFVFQARLRDRLLPWGVAALFAPVQFLLVYDLMKAAYLNPYMGLIPAAFAVPSLLSLVRLVRALPAEAARRNTQLALFAGITFFFITLIFPIQFEKQWITIGWALEGVALLWLRQRIPHPGLTYLGLALLATAFVRLALNPAVLDYHERTATPIFNWYLYAYGLVTVCLFAGSRLLPPPHHLLREVNVAAVLKGLGTSLAFLLLNIEIADYFSTGRTVTFEFSGNFARDMTYSLSWGVFAFLLLVVGIHRRAAAPRYAGLGLLVVTLLKLFLHDIWQLGGFYRIGSLVGLALVLIPVSFLYQRFLAPGAGKPDEPRHGPVTTAKPG